MSTSILLTCVLNLHSNRIKLEVKTNKRIILRQRKMDQASRRLMGQDRKRARAEGKGTSKYEKVAVAEKNTKKAKEKKDKRDTKTERREQRRENTTDKNRSRKAGPIIQKALLLPMLTLMKNIPLEATQTFKTMCPAKHRITFLCSPIPAHLFTKLHY